MMGLFKRRPNRSFQAELVNHASGAVQIFGAGLAGGTPIAARHLCAQFLNYGHSPTGSQGRCDMRELTDAEEKLVAGGSHEGLGLGTAFVASEGKVVAFPTDPILPPNPIRPFILSRGLGVSTVTEI
jgi:hypothetical protein